MYIHIGDKFSQKEVKLQISYLIKVSRDDSRKYSYCPNLSPSLVHVTLDLPTVVDYFSSLPTSQCPAVHSPEMMYSS